jgi:hypothetical protein
VSRATPVDMSRSVTGSRRVPPDICAIGERAGSPQVDHVPFDNSRSIRDILTGGNRNLRNRLIRYWRSTDPPLAPIGLSAFPIAIADNLGDAGLSRRRSRPSATAS